MKVWVPRIQEEGRKTSSSWKLPRREPARQADLHWGWVLPTRPHSESSLLPPSCPEMGEEA